jgi:hypothetical protein
MLFGHYALVPLGVELRTKAGRKLLLCGLIFAFGAVVQRRQENAEPTATTISPVRNSTGIDFFGKEPNHAISFALGCAAAAAGAVGAVGVVRPTRS